MVIMEEHLTMQIKSNHLNDDKSKFTKKVDLASLKYEADKLDIDNSGKVIAGLNSFKLCY